MTDGTFQGGRKDPFWKGHRLAQRLFPGPLVCSRSSEECSRKVERHHKDGNPLNNARDNVEILCTKHHVEADKRHARPEFRAKQRAAKIGRKQSAESNAKRSQTATGRSLSQEHRAAISRGKTGKKRAPFSAEMRANMSRGHTGLKESAETRAKKSEALKRAWARRKAEGA